jgi:hypothetical protein
VIATPAAIRNDTGADNPVISPMCDNRDVPFPPLASGVSDRVPALQNGHCVRVPPDGFGPTSAGWIVPGTA